MYLPAYGKFAEVDPAYDQSKDDPESWNLYNYCTNNPITHTDPDGREELIAPSQAPSEEGPKKENPQKDGKKQGDKQKEKEKEENRELTFREKWQLSLILGPSAYAINVRMVNGKITSGASSNTKKADKAQTSQVSVDPSLLQPSPYRAAFAQLGRDTLGLIPGAKYVGAYLNWNANPSVPDKLYTLTSLTNTPLGTAASAASVVGDIGTIAGIFWRDSILVPMVRSDNRGAQPFNSNGGYNPQFDEGAPF